MIVHYGRKRWHLWTATSSRGRHSTRGVEEAVRVVQGAVLQAPQPTPTLNQSAAAATAAATAAAATAAAILSMALAANMKYHTAKPFSMNIKFRLTISISCTNVSVTKFALGLGQRGQDRRTGRQTVRPVRQIARDRVEWKSQEINSIAKLCQCKSMPNISLSQYLWPQLFFSTWELGAAHLWIGLD